MATAFFTDSSHSLLREAISADTHEIDDDEIEYLFEITDTTNWIHSNSLKKICLQFPDELLNYSSRVYEKLKLMVDVDLYILGDTSFTNCCIDEVAAAHVSADGIVHYGHACFNGSYMHVKYVLPKKKLDIKKVLKILEKDLGREAQICLFYDTSYHHCFDTLKKEWFNIYPNGYIAQVNTKRTPQTVMGRVLIDSESKEVEVNKIGDAVCVYVGERGQTSFNCCVSIKARNWLHLNLENNELLELNEIQWFKRRRFLIEKCRDAQCVGILMCKLSGDNVGDIIKRIKDLCKITKKKSYIVSVGKPNVPKLANFPEIDVYVMVACPENDLYSSREFLSPIVYPYEFEIACNPNRAQYQPYHITDFVDLLPGQRHYCDIGGEIKSNDFSLITGKLRNSQLASTTVSTQLANKSNMELEEIGRNLSVRSWSGLEQKLGETEVRKTEVGRSGIASGYENEKKSP